MGAHQISSGLRRWVLWFCFLLPIFSGSAFCQEADEPAGAAAAAGGTPRVSANSHTGAASAGIAIALPPGRAGLAPGLALAYSSHGKNGWLGVGFSLELASIERSTQKGLDFDAGEFTVNGSAAELVQRPEWGPEHFGAKIESGFTKYRYLGDAGWEALAKDGKRLFFGTSSASRQEDPNDPRRVFKWCLSRVEDSNGNFLTVEYVKDRGEIYPQRVLYTGHRNLAPANAVIFHLEDRSDVLRRYSAGFEAVSAKRLKTIEVQSAGAPVRAYALGYELSGGRSFLKQVVLAGADAAVNPANGEIAGGSRKTIFSAEYSPAAASLTHRPVAIDAAFLQEGTLYPGDFDGDGRSDLFFHQSDSGVNRLFLSEPNGGYTRIDKPIDKGQIDAGGDDEGGAVYTADFDGDGRTDIFYHRPQSGVNRLFLADGAGGFIKVVEPIKSGTVDGGAGNKGGRFHAGDFDGDGLADLFYRRSKTGYHLLFLNLGGGRFAAGVALVGEKSLEEGALHVTDFNGDGLCDLLYHRRESGVNRLYLSQGGLAYTRNEAVLPQQLVTDDGRLQIGDFNGDGLNDALYLNSGLVRLFTNQGRGRFSYQENTALGLAPAAELKGRLASGELSGDGLTDLFFFNPDTGRNRLYTARGDGGFSDRGPMLSAQTIIAAANKYPIVSDVNGDGRAEVLFHRKAAGLASLAQGPDGLPGLLVRIENALGGESRLTYTPSSQFENKNLPFVVPVLTAITTLDGLSDTPESRTLFSYEGGLYDYAEREFRGFEKIKATAPDGAAALSVYHQDKFLQGKTSRVETYAAAGGSLISRSRFVWDNPPIGDTGAVFVKLNGKETEVFDEETISTREEYSYDETNGNLVLSKASGSGAESLLKTTLYANFGDWLLRPVKDTLEGSISGKVRESLFEYERGTGNLIAKEQWLSGGTNPRVTMSCDEYGNLVAIKDSLGHVTKTVYDEKSKSFPIKALLPKAGHVRRTEYDHRFAKPVSITDENGNTTRYGYDVFGRLIHSIFPDGGESFVMYHDEEFPVSVSSRVKENETGSFIQKIQYVDGLGRSIQAISFGEDGKPIATRAVYDAMGRNHETYGPYFAPGTDFPQAIPNRCPWTKTIFDSRGRPAAIEKPDSAHGTITASFSFRGLSSTVTDPDGGSKTQTRDYLGRVIAVVEHGDAGDALTTYAYNAAGDLISVTNALGRTTTMSYDSLGRKTGMEDPDMGRWEYAYDAAGRLISQTDAKNQVIRFEYDTLGRILKKTYSSGDPTVSYTYDGPGVVNGLGRLYLVKNDTATTTYKAYDPSGRVLEVSRSIKGAPKSSYTSFYRYDLAGRLSSIQYPDNYHLSYSYHPGTGLLKSVMGITDFTEYARFESYDAFGRAGDITHANGTATRHEFDPLSARLTGLATHDAQMAELQQKFYHYSKAGDILGIADESGRAESFRYDRQHRLLDDGRLPPVFNESFPLHGPKTVSVAGGSYAITYDANGNMLSMPDLSHPERVRERLIDYNADNMPVRIRYAGEDDTPAPPGGGGSGKPSGSTGSCFIGSARAARPPAATVELTYDGEGRRAVKIAHGTRRTFYIGSHFEVVEGVETKYVFANSMRIAKLSAKTGQLFHTDHLGSAVVVTDLQTGETLETADYHPYGLERGQSGLPVTRHRFTGQEHDAETGLYNYNARLYDPALGVFITPDAIVQDPFDPQTLDRYAYARNNPLKYVDPSGHDFGLTVIIAGAIIGAAISGYQSDWNPKAMLIGAAIGAAAGYMGFVGNALAAEAALAAGCGNTAITLAGATMGGAAAGATSGGLSAAIYGGDISKGVLMGAGIGALAGFSFGAIDSFYSGQWRIDRVAAHTALAGGLNELSGDKFYDGAFFALATSMSAYTYESLVGYELTWEAGGEAVEKKRYDMPVKGANNVGTQGEPIGSNGWFNEGGRVSRLANNVSGINAAAGVHDVFQVNIDRLFGAYGGTMRNILNVPAMIPAAIITYAGLMSGSTPTIYYLASR